ncbi:hypothetical protein Tco_1123940 [Tanacetum coccineum]|uniref:Uncharacterized protein n=1 Tax=Tanacetum coccineum TaxID=301880 RepID=A0ABQ5J681_9ASTR
MYPRFLQLFLNNQLKDLLEPFNDTYETPKHSKKVFSNMTRKSKKISGKVTPLFDSMLVQNQAPEGEGSAIPPEPQPIPSISQLNVSESQTESFQTETPPTISHELQTEAHIEQILPSPSTYQRQQRKTQKYRRAKKVTELPQTSVPLDHEADEAFHKEGEIVSDDRPRHQDTTLGGADAQTRPETVSKMSRDPTLSEVNTSECGEDNMEYHNDLTDFIPPTPMLHLSQKGYCLRGSKDYSRQSDHQIEIEGQEARKEEKGKTPQPMKRRLFKGRVETSTDKSLDKNASKQGRNDDKTEELNLTDGANTKVIVEDKGSGEKGGSTSDQVSTARPEVSTASVPVNVSAATPSTPPTTTTIFGDEDLTIAQTLVKMRSEKAKEKEKGVVLIDEEEPPRLNRSTTTLQPLLTIDPKDKDKGVLVEEEPEKPVKSAELDRAQKEIQKQEEATSAALAKEFDEIQARIDVDHELAVRLTHEEQEKAEAIRNKPPTRTQVRNMMITYLKHMGKYTHQQLKHKNFEEVQKLYEREKKWIDNFKPIDDDSQQQAESTKKRPRADSEEESSKKQKLEEDNDAEKEELRDCMDVVPRDDVAIDVESLATKYPIIFSEMLDDFDRQDVIDLHRLVNERYDWYRIFTKGQKSSQNGQNRARNGKA